MNNFVIEDDGEEKYIFRKSARNSLSKSKTYTTFKISPIRKENDPDDYNIITNNFNKTLIIDFKQNKFGENPVSTNFIKEEKKKSKILPKNKSYSNRKELSGNKKLNEYKLYNKGFTKYHRAVSNKNSNDKGKNIKCKVENKNALFSKNNFENNISLINKDSNMNELKISSKNSILFNKNNETLNILEKNSNKNIENDIELINEELRKLSNSVQDKNNTSKANKFLNVENNKNQSMNKDTHRSSMHEVSLKEDYKSLLKSESYIKVTNLNRNQKVDLNKFLENSKLTKSNEDFLNIELDSQNFLKNLKNNNEFENSIKTEIIEMSNINYDNYNSLNLEKDFLNNSKSISINNDNRNFINHEEKFENQVQKNYIKEDFGKKKLNNSLKDFNKKHQFIREEANHLLNSQNYKKSSIIDILTQEARDKAIIKVESEKIIEDNKNCINQTNAEKIGSLSNRIRTINNYKTYYFTEYHTYTGRRKNIKNFK